MTTEISGPFFVTYYNALLDRRCTLIDNLDEETADAVVEKYGDNGDKFHRMPEVRKERAD